MITKQTESFIVAITIIMKDTVEKKLTSTESNNYHPVIERHVYYYYGKSNENMFK